MINHNGVKPSAPGAPATISVPGRIGHSVLSQYIKFHIAISPPGNVEWNRVYAYIVRVFTYTPNVTVRTTGIRNRVRNLFERSMAIVGVEPDITLDPNAPTMDIGTPAGDLTHTVGDGTAPTNTEVIDHWFRQFFIHDSSVAAPHPFTLPANATALQTAFYSTATSLPDSTWQGPGGHGFFYNLARRAFGYNDPTSPWTHDQTPEQARADLTSALISAGTHAAFHAGMAAISSATVDPSGTIGGLVADGMIHRLLDNDYVDAPGSLAEAIQQWTTRHPNRSLATLLNDQPVSLAH